MGVNGAWAFLKEASVEEFTVTNVKDVTTLINDKERGENIIHVDVVGAFYQVIRNNFMTFVIEENEPLMYPAAEKVLGYASSILNKPSCILYFDGNPTAEQAYGYDSRTYQIMRKQDKLEDILLECSTIPSPEQHQLIMECMSEIFFVTDDIKKALYQVALSQGWKAVEAIGEAEVEIGTRGGIVLSNNSDMLFYPKICTVIRPSNPGLFIVYRKSLILKTLALSNEAFTCLGIIASNGYDDFQFPFVKSFIKNKGKRYQENFKNIYNTIKCIQDALWKNPYLHKRIPVNITVKDYLDCYISFMNSKYYANSTHKEAKIYQNSFNIFVLQRQQILPKSCNFREDSVKHFSYFIDKILAKKP